MEKRGVFILVLLSLILVSSVIVSAQTQSLDQCLRIAKTQEGFPGATKRTDTQRMDYCCKQINLNDPRCKPQTGTVAETTGLTFYLHDPYGLSPRFSRQISCNKVEGKYTCNPLIIDVQNFGSPKCSYKIILEIPNPDDPSSANIASCQKIGNCIYSVSGITEVVSNCHTQKEYQSSLDGLEEVLPLELAQKQPTQPSPGAPLSGKAIEGSNSEENRFIKNPLSLFALGSILSSVLLAFAARRYYLSEGENYNLISRRSFNRFRHSMDSNKYGRSFGEDF